MQMSPFSFELRVCWSVGFMNWLLPVSLNKIITVIVWHNNSAVLWVSWLSAGGFISSSVCFNKESSWKCKRKAHASRRDRCFENNFFPAIKPPFSYILTWTCWNLVESFFKLWACDVGLCVDVAQMAQVWAQNLSLLFKLMVICGDEPCLTWCTWPSLHSNRKVL